MEKIHKKVKIIDSYYDKDKDLISWKLQDISNADEIENIVFPSVNLMEILGIKGNPTPDQLNKFCEDMREKIIDWVHEGERPSIEKRIPDQELNDAIVEEFDNFRDTMEN